jgi:predicted porin
MKKLGASLAILIAAGAAHAADLPTTKAPAAPPPANCYASVWTWLNSSPADCPISAYGITLYATIDMGVGYESNGAGYNQWWNNGVANIITKQNTHGSQWLWTPNGLSQSVVGVKMSEPIGSTGWSLIGTAETGFNPYGINLAYAQKSQVQNNYQSLFLQSANADSSRTGQPLNSQWFLGVSNPTYGTLTGGRVNTLSLDAVNSYDPMSGSYAFSPVGYSGSYAGFGDTEAARANTALKYRINIQNFRLGGLVQVGGYNWGNGTQGIYQGQVGGDFNFSSGGVLSIDGTASFAKDAVNLSTAGTLTQCSTFTKGPLAGETGCSDSVPANYNGSDFAATVSNNIGFMLNTKYKWQAWTFYASYEYIRQQNPSDHYGNGFETAGYFNVPGTIPGFNVPGSTATKAKLTTQWYINNSYNIPRLANVFWVGAKYSVPDAWLHGWGSADLIGAYYWLGQNDYNFAVSTAAATAGITLPAACTTAVTSGVKPNGQDFSIVRLNSGKCAGSTDFISFLIDWRPVKRMDVYAGVMVSNVYGGLANGYYATQDIAPTAGIRIKF